VKLDGVLAIRQSWCRPGEPILLCAGSGGTATRYDIAGADWWGRPERGGLGKLAGALGNAAAGVVDAALADGGPEDSGADAPHVVAWGPGPDSLAATICRPAPVRTWLVLTPHRLACVTVVEEQAEPEPEKSVLDRVSGFARAARDVFSSSSPYPPHQPVLTVEMTTFSELPRERITAVTLAERKLPRQYQHRDSHALRVSLVDGSGVDVLVSGQDRAQRLYAMATGQG
jgi:hypothetical protein